MKQDRRNKVLPEWQDIEEAWADLTLDEPNDLRYYRDGKRKLFDEKGKPFRVLLFSEGRVVNVLRNLDPEKKGTQWNS